MTEHPHELDRETAEQLLSGSPATPGNRDLASLLASASGPTQSHELAGEDAAVMAFRASSAPTRTRRIPVRRLLILKAGAIAALVTAGGLAFASSTGILPTPFKPAPNTSPKPSSSATMATPQPSPSATPAPGPDEGNQGLCNAYLGKSPQERGKALESTAFEALVTAAGGAGNVENYCGALPEKSKKPTPEHPPRDTKPSHGADGGERLTHP